MLEKLLKTNQPCKSSSNDVVFKFVKAKEYYKNIPESNIDPLSNSFQPTKNGGPTLHASRGAKPTTPTKNRFDVLSEV